MDKQVYGVVRGAGGGRDFLTVDAGYMAETLGALSRISLLPPLPSVRGVVNLIIVSLVVQDSCGLRV